MSVCQCGCGAEVKKGKRFLRGHGGFFQKGQSGFKGKKHTLESRAKTSASCKLAGIKPSVHFGNTWNKGRKHKPYSEERKQKISEALKNSPKWKAHLERSKGKHEGENNPAWQGGRSKLPYSYRWTKKFKHEALEKQGNFCHICWVMANSRNYKMDVHHINGDKMDIAEENLIPLCHSCHQKITTRKWQMEIVQLPDGSVPEKKYDTHVLTREEVNAKISAAMKGKPKSPEHQLKLRALAASKRKYANAAEKCRAYRERKKLKEFSMSGV